MGIDPRRLLVLRAVLRAGSMSAAARALGSTQPAVSQQLAVLEREAGLPLVLRSTAGVRATAAGDVLLRRAEAVAGELHRAEEEMVAFSRLRRGVVRLAVFPSAAATIVPRAAAVLARRHPDVQLVLLEAEPPEAMRLVAAGDADLALVFDYADEPGEAVVRVALGEEPVDLVVAAASRLATGPIAVGDLGDETWIAGCVRCREHLIAVCDDHGVEPRISHTTDDFVVVQNLVAAGLGIAVLPRSALTAFRHSDVAVREGLFGSRQIGVVHAPGAEAVPATAAMLAELRRAARAA